MSAPVVAMLVANPCINDTRVLKEATTLAAAGFRVSVLCDSDHGRLSDAAVEGVALLRADLSPRAGAGCAATTPAAPARSAPGAAVPARRASRLGRLLDSHAAGRWLAGLLQRRAIRRAALARLVALAPRVVHAHDLETLAAAAAVARACGAALVYDAHELEQHRLGIGALERRLVAARERRHIGAAAAVITVGEAIARELAATYGIALPTVILNAPSLSRRRGDGRHLRAVLALDAAVPLAVYIGRVARQRGIEETLAALAHWPQLHLACVGGGDAAYAAELDARAATLGVATRFHRVPPVPPFAVMDFVASADLAVVPTRDACLNYRYSLPNKLFEATFAGLPVCASDLPEQRTFLAVAGNGILAEPGDTPAFAAALRRVYAERARLRPQPAALARLAAHYAWDAQGRRLLELYARLVAGGRP